MRFSLVAALMAVLLLSACANDSTTQETDPRTATVTTTDGAAQVTITPRGNRMEFQETSFTVEPGQEVTLVFENTATSPAMQHNVIVLTTGDMTAVNRVGQAALSAGKEAAYIPDDEAVLAATDLAQPGETVEVTFTAPSEPGEYKYICTFPGHYLTMQGTMRVQAAPAA